MKKYILIIFIALLTLATRFYKLDTIPVHLSNDEISIAYDAYSIMNTGRDEHGQRLPISFQSHNTYKAPLYAYLLAPLTKLLPNSAFSARVPSAFLGSLSVLILGLLVFELSKNYSLSLLSAFFLSITPWHIYTSRMALEANVALFCVLLGLYLFFKGISKRNNIFVFFSMIGFAMSLYAYHSEWFIVPIYLVALSLIYFRKKPKIVFLCIVIFVGLCLPLGKDYLNNRKTNARANTEMIWKEPYLEQQLKNPQYSIVKKGQFLTHAVMANYSDYVNFGYLFFNGLRLFPDESNAFNSGLFLSICLPFFIYGLFCIKKFFGTNSRFIWIWVLVSPLISALTHGGTNLVRNLISVAPYTVLISCGFLFFWNKLSTKLLTKIFLVVLIFISFIYFGFIYFKHFPIHSGLGYQYGYRQIAEYIKPINGKYNKIVIEVRFGDYNKYIGIPHLYVPYFTELNPNIMLSRIDTPDGLYFDKYIVKQINWNLEIIEKNTLYVVPVSNLPSDKLGLRLLKEIDLPDASPAFKIFDHFLEDF